MEYIRQSAEMENAEALAELGHITETGGIIDEKSGKFIALTRKNIAKAKELYLEAA